GDSRGDRPGKGSGAGRARLVGGRDGDGELRRVARRAEDDTAGRVDRETGGQVAGAPRVRSGAAVRRQRYPDELGRLVSAVAHGNSWVCGTYGERETMAHRHEGNVGQANNLRRSGNKPL